MLETSDIRADPLADIFAALAWQCEIGADEALADQPVDWTAQAVRPVDWTAQAVRPAPVVRPVAERQPVQMPGSVDATRAPARPYEQGLPPNESAPVPGLADARALAAAAGSLPALAEALGRFEGCSLRRTAMNLVFADGNPQGGVMLIGEAPGEDEDRIGKPFVGPAGRLLDLMLAAIGLDRTRVYITNILPWRPPGNRTPTPAEFALCQPFIERHIALVRPRVLVLLGGTAAKTMLNRAEGITRLRGRWIEYAPPGGERAIDTIATYHPAYLLRSPADKREAWRDMLAIKAKLA